MTIVSNFYVIKKNIVIDLVVSHHSRCLLGWIFGMHVIVVGFRDLASSKEAFLKCSCGIVTIMSNLIFLILKINKK